LNIGNADGGGGGKETKTRDRPSGNRFFQKKDRREKGGGKTGDEAPHFPMEKNLGCLHREKRPGGKRRTQNGKTVQPHAQAKKKRTWGRRAHEGRVKRREQSIIRVASGGMWAPNQKKAERRSGIKSSASRKKSQQTKFCAP